VTSLVLRHRRQFGRSPHGHGIGGIDGERDIPQVCGEATKESRPAVSMRNAWDRETRSPVAGVSCALSMRFCFGKQRTHDNRATLGGGQGTRGVILAVELTGRAPCRPAPHKHAGKPRGVKYFILPHRQGARRHYETSVLESAKFGCYVGAGRGVQRQMSESEFRTGFG
jgi:hypothetical protein